MRRITIAILEDDAERISAMRPVLARDLPSLSVVVHGTVKGMIGWLRTHLAETCLISLDNDLLHPDDAAVDVGEGRDVAEALARATACCPIILHTSNSLAARTMAETLGEAGWPLARVVPHDGVAWVEDWARMVRRLIEDGVAGRGA